MPAVEIKLFEIPAPIDEKRKAWLNLWTNFARLHYALGGLSVTCAAIAATGVSSAQGLAAASAILTALLGFIQPERKYFKFVRAWRELDSAALKYSLGLSDLASLAAAVERGEQQISDYEAKQDTINQPKPGSTPTPPAPPPPKPDPKTPPADSPADPNKPK